MGSTRGQHLLTWLTRNQVPESCAPGGTGLGCTVQQQLRSDLAAPSRSKLGTCHRRLCGGPVVFGRLGVDKAMASPACLQLGPFPFPLTVNRQDYPTFGALFLGLSLPTAETIPETVCKLFISSPFILIPQNYLVTIQGEGHRSTTSSHRAQEDGTQFTRSCGGLGSLHLQL